MRLDPNQDVNGGYGPSPRRRQLPAYSHDWYPDYSSEPYSLPRRSRTHRPLDIQRADSMPSARDRMLSSTDTARPMMLRHVPDAYHPRRPDIVVEEDEDDDITGRWRRPRRRRRTPSPNYVRSPRRGSDDDDMSPVPIPNPESDNDDDNHIEVVEEPDEYEYHSRHHRRHRQPSRDEYLGTSDEHWRQRRQMPSPRHDEIELPYRRAESDDGYPRRALRREESIPGRRGRQPKSYTLVEGSRPPMAPRRPQKIVEREEYIREMRPRRSATVQSRRTRSSSRRPPSVVGGSALGGSSRAPSPERRPRPYMCVVCRDEDLPSARCPLLKCGHRWCDSCLTRHFKLSIKGASLMPPRCCAEHIPIQHVEKLFDSHFKRHWNRKYAESSTKRRIYCTSRQCGEWIKPGNAHHDPETGLKVLTCEYCRTEVCGRCGAKWHYSRDCLMDEEMIRFLEHAEGQGWEQCYKCKAMVELKEGCNHMTCRCGAEFCMMCGGKWKSCDCPWFNYDSGEWIEPERPHPMNMPGPGPRLETREVYIEDPPVPEHAPLPRRQWTREYEEDDYHRRRQEKSDEKMARKLQAFTNDADDYDDFDNVREARGGGNPSGHPANDHFMRGGLKVRASPPAMERAPPPGVNYVPGINMSKVSRGGSMERRLVDRLAEPRQAPPPEMEPVGHRGLGPGPNLMPPPIGISPHGMDGGPYRSRVSERVVVEREMSDYDDGDDDESFYGHHNGKGRRRHRRKEVPREIIREPSPELPKPSVQAGINGRGPGMGRVDLWRKFVQPGEPEAEPAAATA